MITRIFFIGFTALLFSSCTYPKYLPSSNNIDINQYGSYIYVILNSTKSKIKGELIAIDSNNIILLSDDSNLCVTVPLDDVMRFSLRYAKPKQYGWTILAGNLLPTFPFPNPTGNGIMPFHGIFLLFTVPINIIVTASITASSEHSFTYSNKNMTYEKLKMFARFPQGIPNNIDPNTIK